MSFINNAPNIDFENGKEIGYKQAKKETQKLIGKIMELHAPEKSSTTGTAHTASKTSTTEPTKQPTHAKQ